MLDFCIFLMDATNQPTRSGHLQVTFNAGIRTCAQFHSRLRRFRHALAPRGPLPGPHWESQLIWKLAPREAPSLDLIAELNTRLAATQDPDRHWSGLWIDEVPRVRGWAELFQLQLNVADILRDFDFNGRTKLVDIFVIAHKINTADDGEHNTMHISPRYILERKTAQVQLCRPAAPSVTNRAHPRASGPV
jgi:hypothetical protein